MSNLQYNPKFKTIKLCQEILDDTSSNQDDKNSAKLRISEIKAWLEEKNQSSTKANSNFDESVQKEIDQEDELITIARHITVKRYPKMKQEDSVFGQIVNATANRILEIRKVDAIHKLAQSYQGIVN